MGPVLKVYAHTDNVNAHIHNVTARSAVITGTAITPEISIEYHISNNLDLSISRYLKSAVIKILELYYLL